jgi:cardiolipin synthase
VLTIPNLISTARLALIPLFLYVLFGKDDPALAGWVLFVIASTDWIDGYLARRLDQVSELGKLLDPLADRIAIAVAVIFGWVANVLVAWFAVLIIIREALVGVAALVVLGRGGGRIDVRRIGKLATAMVYSAVTWFYWAEGYDWAWLEGSAFAVGVAGLFLYYYVMLEYGRDLRARLAPEPENE